MSQVLQKIVLLILDSDEGNSDIYDNFRDVNDLTDFLSGSGEEYEPDSSELETSDREESRPNPNINNDDSSESFTDQPCPRQLPGRPIRPQWLRVYPPGDPIGLPDKFCVRDPGIKNCPPRYSSPLDYFALFSPRLSGICWLEKQIIMLTKKFRKKL
ncbi:hypothetical protein J6590_012870 [Homalodisca vitripennis]|nr:hypothetical protein J6590_012870 [Homalodisca vitripennis]